MNLRGAFIYKEIQTTGTHGNVGAYSVLDIKKMIPLADGTYYKVDINPNPNDSNSIKKYKDLLNKKYSFCLKIIDELVDKATKLYDRQIKADKLIPFCCAFKTLEEVADKWGV